MPNTNEVMTRAGITRRQIDNWIKREWVKPLRMTGGVGFGGLSYEWTISEMEFVVRMASLVKAGMYPDAAHKVARGNHGALSKLLAAIQPCLLQGELRYTLRVGGLERTGSGGGGGTVGSVPCATPPLPDCVGNEPCD